MAEVIQPPGWVRPRGYSHGMAASGRVLAIAGQVGRDPMTGQFLSPDFVLQFMRALDNVLAVVAAAGGAPSDLIFMTFYVTDRLRFIASTEDLGEGWRGRMGQHYPAITLVEVTGLVDADALVEIQALAVVPPRSAP